MKQSAQDYAALDAYVFSELEKEREREALDRNVSMGGVYIGEIESKPVKTDCRVCGGAFPTSGPSDRMCTRCMGRGWVWKS